MSGTRRIGAACNAACDTHTTGDSSFRALFFLTTVITRRKTVESRAFGLSG